LGVDIVSEAEISMKRILASILTTALIVAMTLAAMFVLVDATLKVTAIVSPLQRAVAIAAELVLGIVLLLGTVWLATHLAVRIFHVQDPPPPGAPLA
jgi:phosphoglycerol transferase MdoB-like AlkP superfamily enzyme